VVRRVATAACAVGLLGGAVAGGVAWASYDHRASASPAAAGGSSGTAATSVASPSGAQAVDWRDVLAALDTARATAFVDADVTALAGVYPPALRVWRAIARRSVALSPRANTRGG
jgi:hypothetical protein